MKYKSESLFTKYQITPSKNLSELRALFQADPNKRKDLPIVIKIINSPAALLEEELFTPHEGGGEASILPVHNRLLKNIAEVMKEANENNVKNALAEINAIAQAKDKWIEFNYYTPTGKAKADLIIQDFLSSLMDEVEKQFFSTIGEISWTKSKKILQYINGSIPYFTWDSNRANEFEEKLIEYVSKLASLEGKSDSLDDRLSSALSIAEFLKNDDITKMLRFSIKKIGDDYDNNGKALLKSYDKIAKLYDAQQLLDMSEFINRMMNKYIDLHGTTNYTGAQIYEIATLLSSAYDALEKKIKASTTTLNYDKNFDKEDIELGKMLSDFVASTNATWINSYKSKLNKVKGNDSAANIYELISHIMSGKPATKKLKNLLANIVIKFTSFQSEIAWVFKCHEDTNKNPNGKHIAASSVDEIIAKYYWTIYMVDEINENLFDNLRGIGFDVLAKVTPLTQSLNAYSSNYERQMVRNALCTALNTIPCDWFMDDKRVERVIKDFGGLCTSSVSVSSDYIDKYDYLFKGTKDSKYGRYKYEHPYSYTPSKSSGSSAYSSSSSSSRSSSTSSSGCYVATCVYNSYNCPQVWKLRRYRDYYLDEHWWGRLFIKLYYKISPTLVRWFGNKKWFRNPVKKILDRKLRKLEKKGYEDTPYNDKY